MEPALVAFLIFSAVSLGITACFQLMSAYWGKEHRLQHRFESEFRKKSSKEEMPSPLFRDLSEMDLEDEPYFGDQTSGDTTFRRERPSQDLISKLRAWLKKSNVPIGLKKLAIISGCLGAGFFLVSLILFPFGIACLGLGFGAGLPLLFIEFKKRQRKEQIIAQLPNAFDLMARVIRAGQSVPQALLAVSETCRGPLAVEFGKCQHQQIMGIRPEVAFFELAQRNDIVELRIFSMAMLIQQQVGGNLTEVLDRLGKMVRDRLHLRKKVKALTAEGRLQAMTLLALPFLMFGVMMFINKDYACVLLEHPVLIVMTICVMGVGAAWIRKIVNFEY